MVVFIVVLNWNDAQDTLQCLQSLSQLKKPTSAKIRIVVVDNGSTDVSVTQLGKVSGITLIKNTTNLGYAGGNNTGIDYALAHKADYIWILNPDLRVDPNCLTAFLSFRESHPQAQVLTPKIYFSPGFEYHTDRYSKKDLGKVVWFAGGRINWSQVLGEHLGLDQVDYGQFKTPIQTEFATGASIFAAAQVFQSLKGFDRRYFLYLEDADFSLRARKEGFEIWYVPQATMWHKNASSSQVGGNLHDYYFARNRLLFGMSHATLRLKLALVKESFKLLVSGRPWQKRGVLDFYLARFGQGSFTPTKAGFTPLKN